MRKFTCLIILSLLFSGGISAKGYFKWSPTAKKAYKKTLELRFAEAQQLLATMKTAEPDNLIRLHVEDYIDFFTVYIGEEEAVFKRLEARKEERLAKISEDGDPESPYYLFLQADIRLHWALARLKFEEYTTTYFETNKAFKLLNKNVRKFPDFIPNKKDLGLLHAIVGTIPDNYRWALEWVSSMEGTVAEGKQELAEVLSYAQHNDFIFTAETQVFYAYLLLHLENDPVSAWQTIQNSQLDAASSPLHTFIIANVATYANRNDYAIKILETCPKGAAFLSFPYLNFMLGEAKLNRLDRDADVYFERFLNEFGGRNFIKDAYRRLSWHALLFKSTNQFKYYQKSILQHGYAIVGEDESAQLEAKEQSTVHPDLLQARLLFDGGYYERASDILQAKSINAFQNEQQQLEFSYRQGRINHALNNFSTAIKHYQQTINRGRYAPHYYACRAALEQGHIYENQKNYAAARKAYKNCLTISPKEHKTGLHQQAKTGILRIN
ncbi:MAG: tol-pal system YbgF family protein [Saprospiraceae bacterium]